MIIFKSPLGKSYQPSPHRVEHFRRTRATSAWKCILIGNSATASGYPPINAGFVTAAYGAKLPAPGDLTVTVLDSTGGSYLAPTIHASPAEIDCVVPAEAAPALLP